MKKVFLLFLILFLYPAFAFGADKIEINTATITQLDEITGIGPVMAQRIIDARPFSSIDDLDRVKGIGAATLQKIKDQGLACVNCDSSITTVITPIISPVATPIATYPAGIFINEIMPNPKGADETDEWIELYNSNNSDVDLSGWQIQDTEGTITTFTINPSTSSGQAKILANGFLVFKRPETKIMLNNDKDGLNLLTPDKKIINSVTFVSAPLGQSYNKTNSTWLWSLTLTPGTKNSIAVAATKTSTSALSKAKNSVKNEIKDAGLANISQALNINQDKNSKTNPWFLFFTVLVITIILAIVVLLIKFKLNKHVRT